MELQKGRNMTEAARILDFSEERQRLAKPKFACPDCKKKGESCPEWITKTNPSSIYLKKIPLDKKIEWLNHTRHLRYPYVL